jgi:hypothetical protein
VRRPPRPFAHVRSFSLSLSLSNYLFIHSLTSVGRWTNAGSFDLLVYTNKDLAVPTTWEESDARFVKDAEEVRLRSFTTSIHRVGTAVAYRVYRDST